MGSLLKGPKAPAVVATPVAPLPDDTAVMQAKKKSIAQQKARGGRQSTILTDINGNSGGAEKLGG